MKRLTAVLAIFFIVLFSGNAFGGDFSLTSPQFGPNGRMADEQLYSGFGCSGKNMSPALMWQGAPEGTRSFAVTVYDPDAPTGSGWWHWVIFNIPADVKELKKNAGDVSAGLAPAGSLQSRTDYGVPGYGGACPPAGDREHRYHFTVYALNTDSLPLDADVSAAMVGFFLNQHVIAKAEITFYYSR